MNDIWVWDFLVDRYSTKMKKALKDPGSYIAVIFPPTGGKPRGLNFEIWLRIRFPFE